MTFKQIKSLTLSLLLITGITINAHPASIISCLNKTKSKPKMISSDVDKAFKIFFALYGTLLATAAVYNAWDNSDACKISRLTKVIVKDDQDFLEKSNEFLVSADYKYGYAIIAINKATNHHDLEKAIEHIIYVEQIRICYSDKHYLHNSYYLHHLNIILGKITNLLKYKPKHTELLANNYQALLQAKQDLEKLAKLITKERIVLHSNEICSLNHFVSLGQTYEYYGPWGQMVIKSLINVNNPELLKKTLSDDLLAVNWSKLEYLDYLKTARQKLQQDLDKFLKANKWHTTPASIAKLLNDLERIYEIVSNSESN